MKIRKIATSIGVIGKILNSKTTSDKDTYSCDYINEKSSYSTEEKIVGEWIDGKPIYRKVITGTKGASTTQVNIGSISGVNEMIKIQGTLDSGSAIVQSIGGYMDNKDNFSFIYFNGGDGSITLVAPASYKGKYIVILEYTKTTD